MDTLVRDLSGQSAEQRSSVEALRVQLERLRNDLKTATGDEYEAIFTRWEETVGRLAEATPIDRERGGVFELELPGDFRALGTAFAAAERWLGRGITDEATDGQIFDFLTALRELANNEFEHSLKLGEPVPADPSYEPRRKPNCSVWLGLVLTWREGQPIAEALLETSGTVPPREVLEQYFEVDEKNDADGDQGMVRLDLKPKPLTSSSQEDFSPEITANHFQGRINELELNEGGRGLQLVAGLMDNDDRLEICYWPNTNSHLVKLTEQLAA